MVKCALISGISGQDGSYLAELLLSMNYEVWGLIRKTSSDTKTNIDHIKQRLHLHYGDLLDGTGIVNVLHQIRINYSELEVLEVYNLGALSHVHISFMMPDYCSGVNGIGTLRFLEAIRHSGYAEKIKFYQASTSELFGRVVSTPQNEATPFNPQSPYAIAKLYAYWMVKNYRDAYGLFACNGILFNHESPRRDPMFVTRKITKGLNDILQKRCSTLKLGNLNSLRDWGHAKDYVYGMWLILQHQTPDDFVLATGIHHSVRDFVQKAFALKGITIAWKGAGLDEVGYDPTTNIEYITVDAQYIRPAEVDLLLGDSAKAQRLLGWTPTYTFDQLVHQMVTNDCSDPI
jgi:GDPmannose 4,6-dehydratase